MAYLYGNYTVTSSTIQQSPQLGLVVQCPNCCSRFCAPFPDHFNNSHSTFIYPQQWPQNVTYSHGSNFQYMQPFIQYPNSQNGMQSIFHPSTLPNCYLPAINQQHQEMIGDINSRQNVSQYAVDMDDIIHRIRDIIIDILNSAICKYGVTIPQLMILLKQSCANYNILLPSSIINNFKEFLHCKMTDYVEIQDDLCRCYIPTLSIQEESISSSSTCGSAANRSKTPPAALMSEITPAIAANASSSTNQMEKVILEKEDVKEKILYRNTEKPSFSPTKVQDNKNEQFCDVTKRQHRNGDVNKMILADRVILDDERESNGLHRHIENNAVIEHSFTKNDLTKIMKEWKEIFVGDIKELIRYLRMVDDYFQGSDGGFTLSKFKEVFGELNKRWEFCDIDLVEMGIINIMHNFDLDDEPVLIVNPIIREMKFPEMIKLATEIYNLLSKLLKSMHSVKVDVVVRTVNFGINDRKTIDEKYVLLWEVLSDSQFQDVFIIDVLQKQNEEYGFDIMVQLNSNLNLSGIFAE